MTLRRAEDMQGTGRGSATRGRKVAHPSFKVPFSPYSAARSHVARSGYRQSSLPPLERRQDSPRHHNRSRAFRRWESHQHQAAMLPSSSQAAFLGEESQEDYNPGGYPNPTTKGANYCYIQQLDLMVNGSSADQFSGGGADAVLDYQRLQELLGYDNKNVTNSLTHQLYNRNCYITGWNLSTSPNPNLVSVQPLVAAAHKMTLKVQFSKPLPCDITMLVWTQVGTDMVIAANQSVGVSFYNAYGGV
jgi:hypothetical protein